MWFSANLFVWESIYKMMYITEIYYIFNIDVRMQSHMSIFIKNIVIRVEYFNIGYYFSVVC